MEKLLSNISLRQYLLKTVYCKVSDVPVHRSCPDFFLSVVHQCIFLSVNLLDFWIVPVIISDGATLPQTWADLYPVTVACWDWLRCSNGWGHLYAPLFFCWSLRTFKTPIKQLDLYQYLLGLIFLIKYLGSTSLDNSQGLNTSGEKAEVGITETVTFFHVAPCGCLFCWWQQPALSQCSKQ